MFFGTGVVAAASPQVASPPLMAPTTVVSESRDTPAPFTPALVNRGRSPCADRHGQDRLDTAPSGQHARSEDVDKTGLTLRRGESRPRLPAIDVHCDPDGETHFVLRGDAMQYVFSTHDGELLHDDWGAPGGPLKPSPTPDRAGWPHLRALQRREFPDNKPGELRVPALRIESEAGHSQCNLRYVRYTPPTPGKPTIPGLPATFAGADLDVQTLQVHLEDADLGLRATLHYTVFPHQNAVARHVELHNQSAASIIIKQLQPFSVDMPARDWQTLQLSGTWGRERTPVRRTVAPGDTCIASRYGFSSHEHNPFWALLDPSVTEEQGDVYALSLVYSGAFATHAEQNPQGLVRLQLGLNPDMFAWELTPGETFHSPECIGVYSSAGLGGMSRAFHDLWRQHLVSTAWQSRLRPVLANSWEYAYMNVDQSSMLRLAAEGRNLGAPDGHAKSPVVKLVVLDDGWFGSARYKRTTDREGLGDWQVNRDKFPEGLSGLLRVIRALGMQVGIWVEPEGANVKSAIYEQCPHWFLRLPNAEPTTHRFQVVLDLSHPEVQEYLIQTFRRIFSEVGQGSESGLDYVKWDINRAIHEVGSAAPVEPGRNPRLRQAEVPHRYILGLYRVLALTQEFKDILFEACASGGGRFDPGMLFYMPQVWCSDNTEALCRLLIQYGTSYVYPASTMGGHVSTGTHQIPRVTDLSFRHLVAMMCGSFGYEMDLSALSPAEKVQAADHVATYERIQPLVHHGDLYRLRDAQHDNWPATQYLAKDGHAAVVFAFQVKAQLLSSVPPLRLRGLEPTARYCVEVLQGERTPEAGTELSGAFLMRHGLSLALSKDCEGTLIHLQRL